MTGLATLQQEWEASEQEALQARAAADEATTKAAAAKDVLDRLTPVVGPYAQAREDRKHDVDDLRDRFENIAKTLACRLSEQCVDALVEALAAYEADVEEMQQSIDDLGVCHDGATVPGRRQACAQAAAELATAQAGLGAIMGEATALGARIDALAARAEAIEKLACSHGDDAEKAYVQLARAIEALDNIYRGVPEPADGDYEGALVARIAELRAALDDKRAAQVACQAELAALEKQLADEQAALVTLQADEGLSWILARVEDACVEGAPGATTKSTSPGDQARG